MSDEAVADQEVLESVVVGVGYVLNALGIIWAGKCLAPPEMPGLPFRPVVFDGLSVMPYVSEASGRPRVAFSLRAKGMRPAEAKRRSAE
jgi:hypothetical protein